MPAPVREWAVVDGAGNGWGRFDDKQDAEDRRDELRATRQSHLYPNDPTAQFDIAKVQT